ncbi:hypothetical protein GF312_22905 [Candidatus Poribacteria bacterium]|nr:hypothetical protein [Candidatus Poribacteria bacterium]
MRIWLYILYILLLNLLLSVTQAQEAVSIGGTLFMLDGKTPHVFVPVQAMSDGEVKVTTLSGGDGKYEFNNIKPGVYHLRCQTLKGYVYYSTRNKKAETDAPGKAVRAAPGDSIRDINFYFPPFKKGSWKNYDTLDGLAYNIISDVHRDLEGIMWFATFGSGISRYDGNKFTNLTTKDGLAHNYVFSIHSGLDGTIWFGTGSGVSKYDGDEFSTFAAESELSGSPVRDIYRNSNGAMWFATLGNGVFRYDGNHLANLKVEDGLAKHKNIVPFEVLRKYGRNNTGLAKRRRIH